MLGNSLLVAPVFHHDGSVTYYVPAGVWTNLLNGNTVQGPCWTREKCDFMSLQLLVRPNTILPMSNRTKRPDYEYSEDVILKVFQFENGGHVQTQIPNLAGDIETTFNVQRENDVIHIQRQGPSKGWKVLLVNIPSIESDHPSEEMPEGVMLSFDRSTNLVEIKILPK